MLYPGNNRSVGIPKDYPTGYEMAKWLAGYIAEHASKYRLRGKCLIKVTTTNIKQILKNELGIDLRKLPPHSASGYLASILTFFDYFMEQRGFTLVERKKNSYNTARYYTMPNCTG